MPDTPVSPELPQKPVKVSRWMIGLTVGAFVLYLATMLVHCGAPQAKDKPQGQAVVAAQPDLQSLAAARAQRLIELAKNRDVIREELLKSGASEQDIIDITSGLPACDQQQRVRLNGQAYYAVNQKTGKTFGFACETDNAWHPLPPQGVDIPAPTPEQASAMARMQQRPIQAGYAGEDGQSKKEKAQAALLAALNSSSVVDFHETAETENDLSPAQSLAAAAAQVPAPKQIEITRPAGQSAPDDKKYPWDKYTGPLYRLFEGQVIEGILTNRLAGEFTGPVNVMVTTDFYSLDRQHTLIPKGTRILGESQKVGINGQQRLAVPFHRIIMPDGFSVDMDQFTGLDQQGASGLTGRVNTHWPKAIATAALVGAIGGLAQIGTTGTTLDPLTSMRLGMTEQAGQEAEQILNRALNVLPTITVYEGTRVRIWIKQDMELPAIEGHQVSPTI